MTFGESTIWREILIEICPDFDDPYTDMDNLIYHVECDDVYEIIKSDISGYDMSDYAVDNVYGIPHATKKIPGLMKDENNSAIMTEVIGLRVRTCTSYVSTARKIRIKLKVLRVTLLPNQ